ncbi:MAG: hypothetical protein CMG55_03695 [Candidatus Marinimicrobia bacterium]|nr:hypothetical protein [Candidatus Neomarinimicrobiota bacterium]|tara:strand:- start:679 stop:1044 length:366 start_codon:yes stop_codon:yes gene_type:complete
MKFLLIIGALFAGFSVLFGAFGAHVLKSRLSSEDLAIFETAVRYQMYHSLGIMLLGILGFYLPHNLIAFPSYFMIIGVIVFSGTLYLLLYTNIRWIGAITPIGGVFLVIGWLFFAFNIYKS